MIIGTGIDIVDIERFAAVFNRHEEKMLLKYFTPNEVKISKDYHISKRVNFFAGRFAAKEAVSKSLGCGFGDKLQWLSVEILPDEKGKPVLVTNKNIVKLILGCTCHISISHEKKYAVASAIISKNYSSSSID